MWSVVFERTDSRPRYIKKVVKKIPFYTSDPHKAKKFKAHAAASKAAKAGEKWVGGPSNGIHLVISSL